jgi:hypothetical protein
VFNATFSNISAISWRQVLVVEEVPGENHQMPRGVIRIRESKDRQHNGQKKKERRTNNDLQNIHIKLKLE